jgi:RHS repeat-associated protein
VGYGYDANGLRIFRTAAGSTKAYSYQGHNLASYQELTTLPNPCPNWDYDRMFTVAPGGVGNAVERHEIDYGGHSTASQYYLYDERGNVQALTDAAGNLVQYYAADAYGNVLYSKDADLQDADPPDITLTDKDYDETTGLYYFNARWYDPETGRFVSRTPLRPDREAVYSFCNAGPTGRTDPTGLFVPGFPLDPFGGLNLFSMLCARRVLREVDNNYSGGEGGDKFKHCLVSCRLVQECGFGISMCAIAGFLYEIMGGWAPDDSSADLQADKVGCLAGMVPARGCECACGKLYPSIPE